MSDQCRHCACCGDIEACNKEECSIKESWYAGELRSEVRVLERALERARLFIENITVPQNTDEAALQVWQGTHVLEGIAFALTERDERIEALEQARKEAEEKRLRRVGVMKALKGEEK